MITDDDLLVALRGVLDTIEPLPPASTAMAEAALGWRTIDAELALLVHDSAIDADAMLVRSRSTATRLLSFATDTLRIDVEYTGGQIVGQVTPPTDAVIELFDRTDTPLCSAGTDEFGAFTISEVPAGLVAITCRSADGSWTVRTSHVAL